jgi:hypothetical protein
MDSIFKHTSLVDSKESNVMGRFVFTNGMAPVFIRSASFVRQTLTGFSQELDHTAIVNFFQACIPRIAHRSICTLDYDCIFQTDRYASQRSSFSLLFLAFIITAQRYFFRHWVNAKQHFSHAVCSIMGFLGSFGISFQHARPRQCPAADLSSKIRDGQ